MTFDIVIATYGHTKWKHLANRRAIPSAYGQGDGTNIITWHDTEGTLASARNRAVEMFGKSDVIVFLDADDELAPDYIHAVRRAIRLSKAGALLLAVPSVTYIRGKREFAPIFPNREQPMTELNWCVIGTAVPRWLFMEVGGFREWPCYEDWELWLRCIRAGATLVDVPAAIYRAHVQPHSRNESAPRDVRKAAYDKIRAEHFSAEKEDD